jgi:uncharacterized membrane protein
MRYMVLRLMTALLAALVIFDFVPPLHERRLADARGVLELARSGWYSLYAGARVVVLAVRWSSRSGARDVLELA